MRLTQLNNAHIALTTWANKDLAMIVLGESGGLGYPERTQEAKWIAEGGILPSQPPKSICPEIKCDPRTARTIRIVQDAYEAMPKILKTLVKIKYHSSAVEGEKIASYKKATGRARRAYYSDLDMALAWVASRLP